MSIQLPLKIINGEFSHSKDTKSAIDSFIRLLLITPTNSYLADPEFGFVFNTLKFEIFNEKEGVIYNSDKHSDINTENYDKKVSGKSENINTFAAELKNAIDKYEKRLSNVYVSMVYVKSQKEIQVIIEGIIVETNEAYNYKTSLKIWN